LISGALYGQLTASVQPTSNDVPPRQSTPVKLRHKLAFVALGALLLAAVAGYFATDDTDTQTAAKTDAQPATVVDRRPLQIAQRLLPLATTAEEKDLAREAVRVGDHSVDLAFTIALLQAAEHPADSTPEIRKLRARLEDAARVVAEDSARLAQLTSRRGSQAIFVEVHKTNLMRTCQAGARDEKAGSHSDIEVLESQMPFVKREKDGIRWTLPDEAVRKTIYENVVELQNGRRIH